MFCTNMVTERRVAF